MAPNNLLIPELREMIAEDDVNEMMVFCTALHPASTADFLIGLTPIEIWTILKHIDFPVRANIFSYFDYELQVKIIESAPRQEIADFIGYLPADDRVDVLSDVAPEVVAEIMLLISTEDRNDITRLSAYPEETCGAEMTSDFVRLNEQMTIQEALNEIVSQANSLETIYYLYVLDEDGRLVGLISAKELLRRVGKPETPIRAFMKRDLITVDANASRESAVLLVAKYDFIAIPVVDNSGKMLGIITHDDILDTAVSEMAENAHLAAAVSSLGDSTYLETGLLDLARKRFMWLAILLVGALSTAFILNVFETTSEKIVWLIIFLPMIVSTGGNSGGQSATLVITALATGEISLFDYRRIMKREIAMGALLGTGMGLLALGNALIICGREVPLLQLLIVPLAVFLVVFSSNMTGAMLPLLFQRLGWDPALMSNPFVAGISDTVGTLIYMLLALVFIMPFI